MLAILFGIFGGVAGVAVACQPRFRSEYVEHVVVGQFHVAVFYLRRPHPVDGHVVAAAQVSVVIVYAPRLRPVVGHVVAVAHLPAAVPSALRLLYVVDHVAAVGQVPAAVLSALRPRSVVGHVVAAVHAPVLNIFPLRFLLRVFLRVSGSFRIPTKVSCFSLRHYGEVKKEIR